MNVKFRFILLAGVCLAFFACKSPAESEPAGTDPGSNTVSITGVAQVGHTLTVNYEGNGTISYQWIRADTADGEGTPILGANSPNYTLTDNDQGKFIKVIITIDGKKITSAATAAVLSKDAPTPTVAEVEVSPANAIAAKGGTLAFTATVIGTNDPAQTVYWEVWEVTGEKASGTSIDADGTLTVGSGETADSLIVRATSTVDNSKYGTATVTVTGPVAITGIAKVGHTLTVSSESGGIGYQWKRADTADAEGTPIPGANSSSYTLTADDQGKFIKVTVTLSDSASITSAATEAVLTADAPTPTVTAVTIKPETAGLLAGGTEAFIATVTGTNDPAQTVIWEVTGGAPGTGITTDGVLTVAANETAKSLTVTATSTIDTGKSGAATVTVLHPAVTNVTVSPPTASVNKGGTRRFTATITTENDPMQTITDDVTWSVTGGIEGTSIANDGTLTVAFGQTANLTVRAASVFDTGKSGTATVTVTTPPLTGSVTINGIVQEEQTLTANTVNLVGDGNGTIGYQWARGDSAAGTFTGIPGATSSTYTAGSGDVGKHIQLTVTRSGYNGSITSDAVGPVLAKTVPLPTVTSVSVTPTTAEVLKSGTRQFFATVAGTNNPAQTVTWTVTGGVTGTGIETNGTLTVSANETAATLTVTATSTIDTSKFATATVTVPALAGSVSVTGNTVVGQQLTASTGSLQGSGTISYQWLRGDTAAAAGTNISGATSSTYTLVTADQDRFIKVTVTRAGYRGSVTSNATAQITLPALTGSVSITGSTIVGQQLTVNTASLGGSGGTIGYQWARVDSAAATTGTPIGTGASYTLAADDAGKFIRVTVTRTGFSGSVSSATAVGPVTLPALTGSVSITGTARVDETLAADTGNLGGSGTVSYQWTRGDSAGGTFSNISGATSSTYTLVTADGGKFIRVTVTRAGNSGAVTSAATAAVALPALTGSVTVTGTAKAGQQLASVTTSLNGSGNISYQWARGDSAGGTFSNITSNGTSQNYTLVTADEGKFIRVTVTRAGNSGTVSSGTIGPIQMQSAADSTANLASPSGAATTNVSEGSRTGITKVEASKLDWMVATYNLSAYKDKEITITLSVEVKREGAAGNLYWQLNNSNYPIIVGMNNAAANTWHTMSGTWTGTPTNGSPVLYLNNDKTAGTTFYYIDNFTITIVETNPVNYNGVTWTNNDLGASSWQKTAINKGYDVEMWNQDRRGTASMTLGVGGAFECSWKGINNVLFRAGKKYNETQTHSQIGTFTIDFEVPTFNLPGGSGSKNAYISVYGWLSGGSPDDLIEYYIIERFGEFNPKNSTGAIARGSATIDGARYEFYEVPRTNAPSIKGDRNFKQYFSIRDSGSSRNSGTISVTQHFNAWANNGLGSMNNAKLYEVALKVESYSGPPNYLAEGNARVTKNILKVNGTPIE